MKNQHTFVAALLCAVFAMPVAVAQDGLYAGAGIGTIKQQDYCDGHPSVTVTSCDDSAGAFRAHVGAQLNDNFAVEAGLTFSGKIKGSGTLPVNGSDEAWDENRKYRALDLSVLGILPLNDTFSVRARAGFAVWKADLKGNVLGTSISIDDDGTDLLYGLGASFAVSEKLSLNADWIRITDSGDHLDMLLAGASYRF